MYVFWGLFTVHQSTRFVSGGGLSVIPNSVMSSGLICPAEGFGLLSINTSFERISFVAWFCEFRIFWYQNRSSHGISCYACQLFGIYTGDSRYFTMQRQNATSSAMHGGACGWGSRVACLVHIRSCNFVANDKECNTMSRAQRDLLYTWAYFRQIQL